MLFCWQSRSPGGRPQGEEAKPTPGAQDNPWEALTHTQGLEETKVKPGSARSRNQLLKAHKSDNGGTQTLPQFPEAAERN